MRIVLAAIAALSATLAPALGFEVQVQGVIAQQKVGKPVMRSDLATLMISSERWCYAQEADSCAWSDIYLDVDAAGASFEVSNAWSETAEIAFVETGTFEDGQSLCESGDDWLPSLRAVQREGGAIIGGRALFMLKGEIASIAPDQAIDCFDYRYLGADAASETITLLQRQSRDGEHDPEQDTEVTLHFNAARAAALSLRW